MTPARDPKQRGNINGVPNPRNQILDTRSSLPNPSFQILAARSRLRDFGCQLLDAWSWVSDPVYQILANSSWLPDPSCQILDTRSWKTWFWPTKYKYYIGFIRFCLWLQRRAQGDHRTAATATLFSQMLIFQGFTNLFRGRRCWALAITTQAVLITRENQWGPGGTPHSISNKYSYTCIQ